jgi:predicted O-linked N-acetylglucosamine transferase (SPINDLY family)
VTASDLVQQGLAHHQAGRFAPAEDCYRQALARQPGHSDALQLLGALLLGQSRSAEAVPLLEKASRKLPAVPEVWSNLAAAQRNTGDAEAAVRSAERALRLRPRFAIAALNLGHALHDLKRGERAEAAYRRAIESDPGFAAGWSALGASLTERGALSDAIAALERAVELDPADAGAQHNLAQALLATGRAGDAVRQIDQALALAPADADMLITASMAYLAAGQPGRAAHSARRASAEPSRAAIAAANLGTALMALGDPQGAIRAFDTALERTASPIAASNRLLALHYCADVSPERSLAEHRAWAAVYAAPLERARPPIRNPDPERRLKIALLSADLGRHPVGFFLSGLLEAHDRAALSITCYDWRTHADDPVRARLRAASDGWVAAHHFDPAALADRLKADEIDIAIDLHGHTAKHRLIALAHRPAPIQMSWMGYVGTTGMDQIDWLIADRWHLPPDQPSPTVERVLRLPDGYISYTPPTDAPAPTPLDQDPARPPVFGAFATASKLSAETFQLWAAVAAAVPAARFRAIYRGLDDPDTGALLRARAAANGLDPTRLELLGERPQHALLAAYGEIDVVLDTTPYAGGLTTVEALYMGVPVVTLPGATFASRHACSHLTVAGCPQWIAEDAAGYIAIAAALAADRALRAELRVSLRGELQRSPLGDHPRFAAGFAAAMRHAWRVAIAEQAADQIR